MTSKSGIIVLGVVLVGLAIALVVTKKSADGWQAQNTASIMDFSNQLVMANSQLNDLHQDNLMLTNDLVTASQTLETISNQLTEATNQLTDAKTELESTQSRVALLKSRVADLEPQGQELVARAGSLSNNIAALDAQIAEAQQQLAASQTNNAALAAKLQQQMAQRVELERRFNDIDEVRAQQSSLTFGFH